MPRYDAALIEPKWQAHWEEHGTFVTSNDPPDGGVGKLYVLDMFPYPSGSGLHVGHPEGYTATDIVARQARMAGRHVLHTMGWDSFGLPAEQHAIETGTHPAVTTQKNIDNFRRQLKMLGFSYDWSRELATTDPGYFRWTQWIFLQLFDSFYDPDHEWTGPDGVQRTGRARPIDELPIPDDVTAAGDDAVRRYRDEHRLAYQSHAPVNWCPALGTVLANEEVTADGRSERGNHPVERRPLRQWMLRITSYAERLLDELEPLDWSESIKSLQRNWIGKSTGAEVDFYIIEESRISHGSQVDGWIENWHRDRAADGFPNQPGDDVLRVYTTRPDTLYGATYMVIAPEHPFVDRLTTPAQKEAVEAYVKQASLKSDLDRTDLAKEKTGVFTGSWAINPVNNAQIPIWIADYVLVSYGTGAIMAVPAHDERDWEFAKTYGLPCRRVVVPGMYSAGFAAWLGDKYFDDIHSLAKWIPKDVADKHGEAIKLQLDENPIPDTHLVCVETDTDGLYIAAKSPVESTHTLGIGGFDGPYEELGLNEVNDREGYAINSADYDGLPTAEFKRKITADLAENGLGREAVNYRLRDWLFSRQRYWGEPFPIWHELDDEGNPTGLVRTVDESELPVELPEMDDFQPKGTPEPPLSFAPDDWLYRTADDGTKLKRETNSMPQWAGSCWYYARFCDPNNAEAFVDPAIERYWLPVDLYIGGAEHAVLHLLYSRFWHKVLFDRGHVSSPEPFQKLVNQGMILGDTFYLHLRLDEYGKPTGQYVSAEIAEEEEQELERRGHSGELVIEEDASGSRYTFGAFGLKVVPIDDVSFETGLPYFEDNGAKFQLTVRVEKMSKSRKNVVNPDDVVRDYGADSLRLYEMFMGPLEQVKPWSMSGVAGVHRFLGKVWRMFVDERAETITLDAAVQDVDPTEDQERALHGCIKAVTEDIAKLSFNTAIARMMEFANTLGPANPRPRSVLEPFVLLLAPFAPHIAEELWHLLGHEESLTYAPWPTHDESKLAVDTIEIPVQINGKLRAKIQAPTGADQPTLETLAREDEAIAEQLAGKNIVKTIVVPGRMVNFVVKG